MRIIIIFVLLILLHSCDHAASDEHRTKDSLDSIKKADSLVMMMPEPRVDSSMNSQTIGDKVDMDEPGKKLRPGPPPPKPKINEN